ncbi:hypothetical protein ABZP36_029502 [Zizania latifolia]
MEMEAVAAAVVVPELDQQTQEAVVVQGARVAGNTCHQCRQKIRGLAASCKLLKKKKNGNLCPIKYCSRCLRNRYGENVEEVTKDETWSCPKCKGICNCSLCMKKKGQSPTGILAHTAKASGCKSVHELLNNGYKGVPALLESSEKVKSAPLKKKDLKRALEPAAAGELLAEGDENVGIDFNSRKVNNGVRRKKDKSPAAPENAVVLPKGTPFTSVAGAEMDLEDVGPAVQFVEFCRTFAEIFRVRKGQPERILQDIAGGRGLRVVSSLVAEFHINLLCIIQEGRGMKPVIYSRDSDAWIVDVGKCISESTFVPKELPLDCLSQGVMGYKNLSPSCKLHVLNFLSNESLSTEKLRSCISAETKNVSEKVHSSKEKDKEPKEATKDNTDEPTLLKTEGAVLTIEENKDAISEIKEGNEVKHAAINEKKHGGFLRTKPILADNGAFYWKLDGHCNNPIMMLQEVDTDDLMGNKDKWFMLNEDEEKIVEDYVSTRPKRQRRKHAPASSTDHIL